MDPSPTTTDTIAAKLRMILFGLRAVLGLWQLDAALVVRVSAQAGRAFGRIERMLARFRAGKLRTGATFPNRKAPEATNPRASALPRKFGWLVIAGKHQAAGYASQLQHLMAEPEMAELLEASPQARRVLRPLCRALAIELTWTVTPPRPRKPRKPRPKPAPYRWPYPRGAVSAARRYKALEKAKDRVRELAAEMLRSVIENRRALAQGCGPS